MCSKEKAVQILYVIDSFKNPHAGTEGQLYQLVQGLDRNRFSPHLLVFHESNYLKENGFPCSYSVLGHSGLTNPSAWLALWKEARRFQKAGGKIVHAFLSTRQSCAPSYLDCMAFMRLYRAGIWGIGTLESTFSYCVAPGVPCLP